MKEELEKMLINLTLEIDELCKSLNWSLLIENLTKQIIRSSSSAALNYGEAQTAESRRDYAHKLSIVLKELKETKVNLKIIRSISKNDQIPNIDEIIDKCDHLIAIFYKTVAKIKKSN